MGDITRDGLLASTEIVAKYFMDFNHKCSSYGVSCVYCFVENYDLCFYPHRVADILGCQSTGIPCDGKQNVISLFALIKSKPAYDKYTTRYFVDADFDNNEMLDTHIYVTSCYSIENLFMNKEVISSILENEYKIRTTENNVKHQLCLDLFETELQSFHDSVMLYNAWYHAQKRRGLTEEMNVCLGESVPSAMIDLTIQSIKANYNKAYLEEKFPKAHKLSDDEIEESRRYLSGDMRRLRGKFEIQFLYAFFIFLNTDANNGRKYTVLTRGIDVKRNMIISVFEKYVSTPEDLRNYIIKGVRAVA